MCNVYCIYSDQSGTSDVDYNKIGRTLRRQKNKAYPSSPQSGEDVAQIFQKPDLMRKFGYSKHDVPKMLYKGTIVENEFVCTFLASETIIALIEENIDVDRRRYLIGATFKIVPIGCFKQLLIIYVEYIESVSLYSNF